MPELPEVETIKRELKRVLVGQIINDLEVYWSKTILPLTPAELLRKVDGETITDVTRRAKILMIKLGNGERLLIHLKMAGQLIYVPPPLLRGGVRGGAKIIVGGHPQPGGADNLPNKYTRVIFSFNDKSRLFFNDLRKFGWMKLLDAPAATKLLGTHGVEPLSRDFTRRTFDAILARYSRRKIKQLLLDQTLIAGLGNIYADESCFLARILPTRTVESLNEKEKLDLHRGIILILKLSIQKKGTSSNNYRRSDGSKGNFMKYLKVYGRTGKKCKRCRRGMVEKIKVGGRGTHFCRRCQN